MAEDSNTRPETERLADATKAAVEKLSEEAGRLKQLSELRSLKENPVEISVDKQDLIDHVSASDRTGEGFRNVKDLMDFLRLLSA